MIKKINVRKAVVIKQSNADYIYKTEMYIGELAWRWNPKLKSYIYTKTNKIHIINIPELIRVFVKAFGLLSEVIRYRGRFVVVANNSANGQTILNLVKKTRQPSVKNPYHAGGLTRKKENIRQYLELKKGLTNIQVRKKFIVQLLGLQGMSAKPPLMLILDAKQGEHLLNECKLRGISTIACGDTTLNLPKITYPVVGNFKGRVQRIAVLLLMYHAIFDGMRQELLQFANYSTQVKTLKKIVVQGCIQAHYRKEVCDGIKKEYNRKKVVAKEKKIQANTRKWEEEEQNRKEAIKKEEERNRLGNNSNKSIKGNVETFFGEDNIKKNEFN
ncbi:hypothetical protein RB653_003313 (mitochondrion) [Dictyostelium firmibasis]|uniref:Ribosomal protein S2 n=1 Tax=Dictyostelium firmibasis TaxID=79012 RepID=A0AAN7TQP9_9MYCE